ncbi:uncharacterized protein Triagg1_4144 [Trichoderma aggressivum f. europaeum]|uniref:Thioredoxin domain-containing protein n=1 Tax=Trichoderma aggressivum f. europaeum TaxID=173218 RepID=A0AAE1M5Z3_9HYPO|nr:hypothetical protein Triagg1_4144 [Trichoderma aggressivum f. europaeum]
MATAPTKVGSAFPANLIFSHIPAAADPGPITTSGSAPVPYNASEEFAHKKVVLFSVPGAFTRTCSNKHLPGFLDNIDNFKKKGVDIVACIAHNDAHVMNAWRKAFNVQSEDILFLSETDLGLSRQLDWTNGDRGARYALIIDNGIIVYAEQETERGAVTVSAAEAVLNRL